MYYWHLVIAAIGVFCLVVAYICMAPKRKFEPQSETLLSFWAKPPAKKPALEAANASGYAFENISSL